MHEQFARGFEAYLLEGRAPSKELRGMFRTFKQWLMAVYESVSQLNVNLSDIAIFTQALGGSFTVYLDGNLFRIAGEDADALGKEPVPPPQLPQRIDGLVVRNRNTHRIVHVRNIRIFDKTARGDYRALNPLSSADDALIEMNPDGVVEKALRVAISVEEREYQDIYPRFRDQARAEGRDKEAEVYQRVVDSESQHADWFRAALAEFETTQAAAVH